MSNDDQWLTIARSMNRRLLDAVGAPESVDPISTDAEEILYRALTGDLGEPYGYVWFNEHMEQRFTHIKPLSAIGEIIPVYRR